MEICLIDEAQRGKLERGEDSQVTCVNSHRATSDLNDADFFLKENNIIHLYFIMFRMQKMYYGLSFFHSGLISRKILSLSNWTVAHFVIKRLYRFHGIGQ